VCHEVEVCNEVEVWDLAKTLSKCRRYGEPMKLGIGDTDSSYVDVFTPSGYFQYKAEVWSSQRLMGGNDTRAPAKATDKAVGDIVVPTENYELVPVFEDPVYQRSERVAARKVQLATREAP
jgi:hypothetical protein